MTAGKTFVSEVIRKHRYEIDIVRKHIKRAKPRPVPRNLVWAADLTGKTTLDGSIHPVLVILEHASRAALRFEALRAKSSWSLVLQLVEAIKRYGRPRMLRTDNESVFTSAVFRFALFLLGIRHQRTDPGCPWQNGRVERFFGTLKEKLDRLAVDSLATLSTALVEFRFFCNHVRAHQNLDGRTPAEAWAGIDPFAHAAQEGILVRSLGRIAEGLLPEEVRSDPARHIAHQPVQAVRGLSAPSSRFANEKTKPR